MTDRNERRPGSADKTVWDIRRATLSQILVDVTIQNCVD